MDSTYLILVMGESFLSDNSATYMVSFTTGDGNVILSEDIPFTGVVVEEDYDYYLFPIHYNHEDVTLSLSVLSGDADLYISTNPLNPNPTKDLYNFKSTQFGSESITLVWENGLREQCIGLPDTYTFGDKSQCFLYIGVFGYHTSTYIIRIHPSKNLPRMVNLGQSVSGNLNITMYDFYYAIIDTTIELISVIHPEFGDSDLYVNIYDKNISGSDTSKWGRPTKENSMYSSRSTVMSDEVSLTSQELTVLCPSHSCIAVAGVYCFSQVCTYSFSMRQNQIIKLTENQPFYGEASIEYQYYSYYCDKESTDFLVMVTPLNDGNPDLFISKGADKRPTSASSDWQSTGWGGDSILITKTDPYFTKPGIGSMKGTYIIGIQSIWSWGPSSYSIVVNNNPTPIISINSGLPQYGGLSANNTAYYKFNNYINVDIQIVLTPITGSGAMYANAYYGYEGNIQTLLPGEASYIWSSSSNSDRYTLNINANDPKFCTYCSIVIAVKAETKLFNYSIIAKNNLDFSVLLNGIPSKSESVPNK